MARLRWRPGRLAADRPASPGLGAAMEAERGLFPLPGPMTLPLAWCYGLGRRAHRALAILGLRPRRRLAVPVVCVGNLSVGGTGKTPFVQMLASEMVRQGRRPAILSRGYGAAERHDRPLVVSDGQGSTTSVEQAGDEPLMLARACPGVPVVTCSDRSRAGREAIRRFGSGVLILDDGFQHDRLRRDLDIVLWDLSDLPSRMRVLPAGRLREGLSALGRAQAIVLTHGEYLDAERLAQRRPLVIRQIKKIAPHVPIFEAQTLITGYDRISGRLRGEAGEAGDSNWPWRGRRVLAVSGVARPRGFETMLQADGAQVGRHFVYPDHYTYDTWLFDDWRDAAQREGAEMILTTEKDGVKLAQLPIFGLTIVAVRIAMRITEPQRWELFLRQSLESQVPGFKLQVAPQGPELET
jgi:tetraacyldisaccharide 4'-kinase